jgi:hypothetical protein
VERVVLNALAKYMRPCRLIYLAPSAITLGIVFGEADPPKAKAVCESQCGD